MSVGEFQPYSMSHLLAVGGSFAAASLAVGVGLGRRETGSEHAWRWGVGAFTLLIWLVSTALWARPSSYDPASSLPLHVCDLSGVIIPLAILTRRPWLMGVAYYWGLALSSNAFLTPTLNEPFPTLLFFNFWATHTAIVGGAVYLVIVEGYRPTLRHLAIAFALLGAYAAAVLPLDIATGWNYGYIGPSNPSRPTVIDMLGPWPLRVVWMGLLSLAAMLVCWLPWGLARWWTGGGVAAGPDRPT